MGGASWSGSFPKQCEVRRANGRAAGRVAHFDPARARESFFNVGINCVELRETVQTMFSPACLLSVSSACHVAGTLDSADLEAEGLVLDGSVSWTSVVLLQRV